MRQTNEKLEGGADQLPAVWRIAVVGGGPAGLSFCLQLFDKLQLPSALNGRRLQIGLFEKSSQIGPGLAYAKSGSFGHTQLLNVPRDGMTAFAGRFGQFSRWIREMAGERKEQWPEGVEQELFPPRHIFGEFLAHLGEKLREKVADHPNIQIHFGTMTRVENIERRRGPGQLEEFKLELARPGGKEEEWIADQVILCSGHLPEDTFQQLIGRPGYVHDWATRKRAFQGMSPQDCVAIAGTKLSAIDICLELRARGHLGPVLMCSRTGLLPAVFVPLPLLAKREGNGQGQSEGEEYWQPYGLGMERGEKALALCGGDGIILAKNLHGHESRKELLFWQKQGKTDGQVNKDGQRWRIGCIEMTSKKLRKDSSGGTEEGNGGTPWNIPMLAPGHVFGQVVGKLLQEGQEEEAQIMQNVAEAMFAEIVKLEGPNCKWAQLGRAKEKLLGMGPRQWLDWQLSASRAGQPPSWQLVIFALYPMLPAIWQSLPHSEKQTFYKHFYSLFQSFSAAMPAQNALKIREMLALGQLRILSDLEPIEWDEGAGEFHLKGQMKEENGKVPVTVHKVKWLFNATGPGFSPMNVPLLARLVHNGMARENPFGGFHIDPQTFRVLPKKAGQRNGGDGQNGFQKMNGLFAIGELTKGDFLLTSEMNKVAEQAEKLAKMVAEVMIMARAE